MGYLRDAVLGASAKQAEKDAADAEDRKSRRGFGRDAFYDLTADNSPHYLRILPRGYDGVEYVPNGRIHMPVFRHMNIPGTSITDRFTKEKRQASCVCIKHTFPERDEECVICGAAQDMYDKFKALGLTDKQQARFKGKYYLQKKAYANVISRESEERVKVKVGTKGRTIEIPKIWIVGFTPTVREWLDKKMALKRRSTGAHVYADITDPESGLDVIVEVTGKMLDTKYDISFAEQRTPIDEDERVMDAILRNCHNLAQKFSFPTSKEINEMRVYEDAFQARIGEMEEIATKRGRGGDEEEDEERPRRSTTSKSSSSSSSSTKSKRARDEDEEDEDEEEAPARTKKQSIRSDDGASTAKKRPECFGNHLPGVARCLGCPVELRCKASPRSQSRSLARKKRNHARIFG